MHSEAEDEMMVDDRNETVVKRVDSFSVVLS